MRYIITSGRVASVIACLSVVAHLTAAVGSPMHAIATTVLVVMAFGCLFCAWHLWNAPTARRWVQTLLMYGAMLVAHHKINVHSHGHHQHVASGFGMMLTVSLVLMFSMAVLASLNLVLAIVWSERDNPGRARTNSRADGSDRA
jgi:hypothetical protein